jgi:hypothetical protein
MAVCLAAVSPELAVHHLFENISVVSKTEYVDRLNSRDTGLSHLYCMFVSGKELAKVSV